MDDITLKSIDPATIYDLHPETNLMYRFIGKKMYMMNYAKEVHIHKFDSAMEECYVVPTVENR